MLHVKCETFKSRVHVRDHTTMKKYRENHSVPFSLGPFHSFLGC